MQNQATMRSQKLHLHNVSRDLISEGNALLLGEIWETLEVYNASCVGY